MNDTDCSKTTACHACNKEIAKSADKCPSCGAENVWLHPEIIRLSDAIKAFNFLPSGSRVFWKNYKLWGVYETSRRDVNTPLSKVSKLATLGLIISPMGWFFSSSLIFYFSTLMFIVSAIVAALTYEPSMDELETELVAKKFILDFSTNPPTWNTNNEDFWKTIKDFFQIDINNREISSTPDNDHPSERHQGSEEISDPTELDLWLNSIGFGKHIPSFKTHNKTIQDLGVMTYEDIRHIVRNSDDARIIMNEILKS